MDNDEFDPPAGVAEPLGDGIRRILAPNPSPMTWRGTNTYLLGRRDVAVIDPGPDIPAHLAAILGALGPGQRITHVFVTHSHVDHSPLAARLARETGARVLGFGPSGTGRSAIMRELAARGLSRAGEGIDARFHPDERLDDGARIEGEDWALTAHWTPGHLGNHLCFCFGDVVFTGDLVMGWASSLVSPPDGDLSDFMASCRRLKALPARVFHAGHGAPITDPAGRLDWLIAHRQTRERAILEALSRGPADIKALTDVIYADTPAALHPAARRNVLAHLVDLTQKNLVIPERELDQDAIFRLA